MGAACTCSAGIAWALSVESTLILQYLTRSLINSTHWWTMDGAFGPDRPPATHRSFLPNKSQTPVLDRRAGPSNTFHRGQQVHYTVVVDNQGRADVESYTVTLQQVGAGLLEHPRSRQSESQAQ